MLFLDNRHNEADSIPHFSDTPLLQEGGKFLTADDTDRADGNVLNPHPCIRVIRG
jgi:hypothetical protein